MSRDLERAFGQLAENVPELSDEAFVFSSETLPVPDEQFETAKLVIQKGFHDYLDCYRADMLTIHARKSTYRHLGLLILAVVFHQPQSAVDLVLTHPATHVKRVVVATERMQLDDVLRGYATGFVTRPLAFGYRPKHAPRYPWSNVNPQDLPRFLLTRIDDALLVTSEDWEQRDTVKGFGRDTGSVLLAELLLNASLSDNTEYEYQLEGDAGVRGVGPMSAEVRFLLPGHPYWDGDILP